MRRCSHSSFRGPGRPPDNRQARLAAAFATPIAILLGVLVVAVLNGEATLTRLLDRRVLIGLVVLDAVVLVWRLSAVLQAHRRRAPFRASLVGTYLTGALVIAMLFMHAAPGLYGLKLLETLNAVSLEGNGRSDSIRETIPGFGGPSDDSGPLAPPEVESGGRTNILLVGVDSGIGRDHALTDTMLVVSLDPGGKSAMLSIPRDLVNAPLPDGQPYPLKLNSLFQTASGDPGGYPFGGGVATLKQTIAELLGVPIHYIAAVDMAGFEQVIDAIGGVTVTVETPLADPSSNLYLNPGPVFMDGELALRYVRSRHGVGNDDLVRAGRQQQLLAAIRDQLAAANLVTSLPRLLDALQNTVATDVPADRISELAATVQAAGVTSLSARLSSRLTTLRPRRALTVPTSFYQTSRTSGV